MKIKNANGDAVELDDSVFSVDFNESLVHQVVVSYMAAGRSGSKSQKSRSDVSGGGIKPWRQKGTGRARAGTSRGPIWRKGGVTFAARPRDYAKKVNKKMYRSAMRSILSELVRSNSLVVVDDFGVSSPSTKSMVAKLSSLGVDGSSLLVGSDIDVNTALSSRNIADCEYVALSSLGPVDLVSCEKVIMTSSAVSGIQEWLS